MPLPSVLGVRENGDGREPTFAILESKLAPGHVRPGSVPRTALVDRLCGSSAPVVAVAAPAGSGKTTSSPVGRADDRPFAWVSLTRVTTTRPCARLSRGGGRTRRTHRSARVRGAAAPAPAIRSVVVPRLGAALRGAALRARLRRRHRLRTPASLDMLASLSDHLPGGAHRRPGRAQRRGFPLARLRAHGQLEELGAERSRSMRRRPRCC